MAAEEFLEQLRICHDDPPNNAVTNTAVTTNPIITYWSELAPAFTWLPALQPSLTVKHGVEIRAH